MKRFATAACLAINLVGASAIAGVEVKGVTFADSYQVGNQALVLNGAGVRVKFIVVYAAGLYLPKKESGAATVIAQPGPKSVQIVLLREISGDDFAEATEKGFKSNNTEAELARFQGKLDELKTVMRSFGTVKKGTTVNINITSAGLSILVNGEAKGDIAANDEFLRALLKNWLGTKPVDADLKQALLGT